jgi:hypothetical protein
MSVLRDRILAQPGNMTAHAADVLQPLDSGHPAPPQIMTMPLSVVTVTADAQQVAEAVPLWTNRGVVPATAPGQWVQVRAAGRP